jgi:hypothetical protein
MRKTVPFSVPAKSNPTEGDITIEAGSDAWVSERGGHGGEASTHRAAASLILDLAAERGLIEVVALSILAPFALGFFWLMNAAAGRVRL